MNHDSVNAIADTIESQQIAEEARVVYYDLMDRDDWPHLITLLPLDSLVDVTRPNYLVIPEDVVRIDNIRYETTKSGETVRIFSNVTYLAPGDFLDLVYTRNNTVSTVTVVPSLNNVDMWITNDTPPQWWTTFDDANIVFDSWDSGIDTTMQGGKSMALVKKIPPWTSSDAFIPDMPDQMFSTFVSEVTAAAFTYWKQGASIKDEQRSARGISNLRRTARKHNEHNFKAKHGRPRSHFFVRSEDGVQGSIRQSLSRF